MGTLEIHATHGSGLDTTTTGLYSSFRPTTGLYSVMADRCYHPGFLSNRHNGFVVGRSWIVGGFRGKKKLVSLDPNP
jgi:hypothetical protein